MAALASKTAAQARIRTLSACEALNHPNPRYLAPSTTHSISERHREKVVKWINEVRAQFSARFRPAPAHHYPITHPPRKSPPPPTPNARPRPPKASPR